MKFKIKIKQKIEEENSMSSGAVQGYGSPFGDKETVDSFNDKQENEQRLKGQKLAEMYSTRGLSGMNAQQLISGEREHAGHVKRSKQQGLKNVTEANDETISVDSPDPNATEVSPRAPVVKKYGNAVAQSLRDRELEVVKELGSGMFGTVYKVLEGGAPFALKIVGKGIQFNGVDWQAREKRNYDLVGKARKKSPLIAKHFPSVHMIWEVNDNVLIMMEYLEPVSDPSAVFVPDKTHLLSRAQKNLAAVGPLPKKPGYHDQSLKAETYFASSFMNFLSGFGTKLEQKINNDFPPIDNQPKDFDEEKISLSASSMLHLRSMKPEDLEEKKQLFFGTIQNWALAFPKTYGALSVIEEETKGAPYFLVALSIIAMAIIKMISTNNNQLEPVLIDDFILEVVDRIVKEYRQFSAFKMGYKEKEIGKETNPLSKEWNETFKELHALTNLTPKDMHYGNVMQRANGDLVIIDLGLFREESEPGFKMFETKTRKYRVNLLSNPKK